MTAALTAAHGVLVLGPEEMLDRARWLAARQSGIGASEIAAAIGISPWGSPFSLFWRKKLAVETEMNEAMEWGLRHEQAIAAKFAENHPQFDVVAAGLYRHPDHEWMLATPDRILRPHDGGPDQLCQIKTTYSWDGWGEPGSGNIPVYYRAQVMQEMGVYGATRAWLPVLSGGNSYREYTVEFDPADYEVGHTAGEAMMRRLADDDPPDVDGSAATLTTLKRLHPSVADEVVTLPLHLADQYRVRKALLDDAKAAYDEVCNKVRAALGDAGLAVADGRKVAYRSVYERHGLDLKALRADHPDFDFNPYETTTVVDTLKPAKEK